MRITPWSPLLGLLALAGCSSSPAAPSAGPSAPAPQPRPVAAEIAVEELAAHVGVLAHDSLRGREVGTPGAASAARYLAAEAARLGLRPADPARGFLTPVGLRRRAVSARVEVVRNSRTRSLAAAEILPVSGIGGLPETSRASGEGKLVYAGYLNDPDIGADELRPEQLRRAVVVIRLGAPAGVRAGTDAPRLPLALLFSPASEAAAVVLVPSEQDGDFWAYAAEVGTRGVVELERPRQPGAGPAVFLVSGVAARSALGIPDEATRRPRTGLGTFRFALTERSTPVQGWNVAAVLPGRDPALRAEHVALGSHYDHVGVGEPVDGDSVYNGADDDASGTAALLAIAGRVASLPEAHRPARSLLFVWHTAEESGLLGSDVFTESPPVPRESIVAQLNLDMVGRNHPDSLFVVGAHRLSTTLGNRLMAVNAAQPRPFALDFAYDAPGHPEQLYCRSDHFNYARFGIPIAFFTTGLHPDYHKPSDEVSRLDFAKLARVARMVADLATDLGNLPARPAVDRPVPPRDAPCM